jgi:TPR repeat protein
MTTALVIGRPAAAGIDRRLLAGFLVSILVHGLMLGSLIKSGRNAATPGRHVAPTDVEVQLLEAAPASPPPAKRALAPKAVVTASHSNHSNETKPVVDDSVRSDLHYRTFYDDNPTHPMRCMVGPVAEASGDHEGAIYIFSDCAKNGDNFSAISLAHYYELGLGGAGKDPAKAAELFRSVATSQREAYRTNGMLYYGLCLYFGFGVPEDRAAGREWLMRAAAGGDPDAVRFLASEAAGETPSSGQYFKR